MSPMRSVRFALLVFALAFPHMLASAQTAPLGNGDVVKMTQAGLSEPVIIQTIKSSESPSFDLSAAGLISLKSSGVSDAVITEMVTKGADVERAPRGSAVATVSSVAVPDATELRLRLLTPVSSGTARQEDPLRFEVTDDVKSGGVTVLEKGAAARGRVSEVQGSRSFGRSGKLNFSIDSVDAVDGSVIPIRSNRELKGDARVGATVAAVALVGVFGGFVKGKNIEAPAGSEYTVFTDGERRVSIATPGKP